MRLIDADAALRSLPDDLPYKAAVKRVLIQAETVDAVPVVRCKDCKYFLPQTKRGFTACSYRGGGMLAPKPNDFCGYGERREAGNGQKESET